MESSTIVIKVKYGETLRRFNARVVGEVLDLNMGGLTEKIMGLFGFAPDAEITLTYVDEDGDVVTLADDEDIRDVVRQSLNPVRITVKLDAEKSSRASVRSSGSPSPLRSPRVQPPLQTLNSGVSEILKSLPEPIREAMSKLSTDLASKASSSAPGVAELVDYFSKMGLSYLNQHPEPVAPAQTGKQDGPSRTPGDTAGTEDPLHQKQSDESKSEVVLVQSSKCKESKVGQEAASRKSGLKTNECGPSKVTEPLEAAEKLDVGKEPETAGLGTEFIKVSHTVGHINSKAVSLDPKPMKKKKEVKRIAEYPPSSSSVGSSYVKDCVLGDNVPLANNQGGNSPTVWFSGQKSVDKAASGCPPGYIPWVGPDSQASGGMLKFWNNVIGSTSGSVPVPSPVNECPFTGLPLPSHPDVPVQHASRFFPFKRSYSQNDGAGSIFHRGVRCDGCGVHPITGPRFKSKVEEDYDLCSVCFAGMGNNADYIRIDRPLTYSRPSSFKGLYDPVHNSRTRSHVLPHVLRGCGAKPVRSKLDSRFIQDVNVLDGTVMAPSTPFTKIWRMMNTGTIIWPQGTHLVWIGGDRLSDKFCIEVEIPGSGLPVDQELDVAVDFVAPEHPGRYISYWRMASPTGQKFGQRVWVLIQVDASRNELLNEGIRGLNLNLPPVINAVNGPEPVSVNPETIMDISLPQSDNSKGTDLVEPLVDARSRDPEVNFPTNNNLLIGDPVSSPGPSAPSSSVSYPMIDLTEVAPALVLPEPPVIVVPSSASSSFGAAGPSMAPPVAVDATPAGSSFAGVVLPPIPTTFTDDLPSNAPRSSFAGVVPPPIPTTFTDGVPSNAGAPAQDVTGVEESLLRELEEMGFKQVELNKEILRLNEYNLEQSLDDLCGVAEWDPILEELEEMGFADKEMNRKLLKKNNGSIKRVVMDLIAGEKIFSN